MSLRSWTRKHLHLLTYEPQEICDSQEAWWLRKGCQRTRARLIKALADKFEIPVRTVQVCLEIFLVQLLHRDFLVDAAVLALLVARMAAEEEAAPEPRGQADGGRVRSLVLHVMHA
jgi:hypothetical protein